MSISEPSIDLKFLPQDPFLPLTEPKGPTFVDTEGCVCTLKNLSKTHTTAWQCIGNQTERFDESHYGKWFEPLQSDANVELLIYDASNGPRLDKSFVWNNKTKSLRPLLNKKRLSVSDRVCTGVNNTLFSTSFYRAANELRELKFPIDAAPCWRPGAVPLMLQGLHSWVTDGCSEGFLCINNTVNSLPQFCPPLEECQISRLAGVQCTLDGRNVGMGPFEPVLCPRGWYCPEERNGKEVIVCPAGSYCQQGAPTPTPCNIGSRCPEGSSYELYLIPVILLAIFDFLFALGFLLTKYRGRIRSKSTKKQHASLQQLNHRHQPGEANDAIPEECQSDITLTGATYVPGREDSWVGFSESVQAPREKGNHQTEPILTPQLGAFVKSMRTATEVTNFGLSFRYEGLGFQPSGSTKPILHNVTGSIDRGSLVAVMGGSGAGKSTFVNVLMGKTSHTEGIVSVNDVPDKMKRYKKLTGYVPQDDIVLPDLTVYENIAHSARVRLPRKWSIKAVEAHVDSVIDCLELSHVRNSKVGSVGKPLISGGQRKRVSIGMELAAAPMAIFLDEPTSGLDATAASSMMQTLKAIARLGISVIVIIHQPRMEIFDMFDKLILLACGQTIYEGPQDGVQGYFKSAGFGFPPHSNHADVITDIITGNGRNYKRAGDISKESLISCWNSRNTQRSRASSRATLLSSSAKSDSNSERTSLRRSGLLSIKSMMGNDALGQARKRRGAPYWKQIWLCLWRAMNQQYRAAGTFWSEMGLATLAGALLGLSENPKKGVLFIGFYKAPYGILSTAADFKSAPEMALLTAIAIGLVAAAPGVKTFSEETLLHRREAEAGHSRLAYFIAKVLSVFPRMVLACLHFTVPLFLLAVPVIPWGLAFFANLLYFYCIYGLASCVSMVIRREDAPLFATMLALIVGILSGAAPPLSQVKQWHIEWLWRASPGVWLAELYFGQLVSPYKYLYEVEYAATSAGYHLNWTRRNLCVLFVIGTLYRIIAYIGMVAGHRLRR